MSSTTRLTYTQETGQVDVLEREGQPTRVKTARGWAWKAQKATTALAQHGHASDKWTRLRGRAK
jgi:hypothetical protein